MKRKSHEDFISELKQLNPNINVVGEYINCSTKIEVCCLTCNHSWYATPNSLLRGSGCPQCANNQKKSHDRFVFEMEEYNPHVEILETYINSHTPLKVKCRICGSEWMCKPMRLLHGARCQNCIKPHTSFMEQFILISFQKVIGKDAVESRNTTAIGLELDIYIPNYNFAIEPGTWLYHKKKASNTDLFKRQECQKNGIKLITIYDTYPTNLPPPFETDCYVFAGFLNEYGYGRMIELIKKMMSNMSIDYTGLDWNQIANEAYANCHYDAHLVFINELNVVNPNIEVLEEYKGSNIPISVNEYSAQVEHPGRLKLNTLVAFG